jgi:polar amino acid transport system substrate-binding protein
MKRLVMFTLVMMLSATLAAAVDRPFIVAGDEDEAPYGYLNEKQEFVGIYVDLLREAFKRLNVPLEHTPYPWKRAQFLVENGQADAMITVMTPKRAEFTVASKEALAEHKWVAFVRNDHPDLAKIKTYTTLAQFQGLEVLDYSGDGWGEEKLKSLNPKTSGNFTQAVLKLAGKRGDVFIQMEIVTKAQIKKLMQQPENKKLELEKIEAMPNVLDSKVFYLLVAKQSPYRDLLPKIDEVIAQMKQDGTIKQIEAQYTK